jgi:DNA-binding GntR family transcriptional regulator
LPSTVSRAAARAVTTIRYPASSRVVEPRSDLVVHHRSMADEVTDRTRRLILSRELRPGQRVKQAELATMMGVSTMPVREALLRLVAEGMVLADSNRSFSVAMTTTPSGIRDIYWIHSVLAAELSVRAWEVRDDALLATMTARNAAYAAALRSGNGGPPVLFRENSEFHSAIHDAASAPAIALTLKNTLRYFPDSSYDVAGWNEAAKEWQDGLIAEFEHGTADGVRTVISASCSKSAELYIAALWPDDPTSLPARVAAKPAARAAKTAKPAARPSPAKAPAKKAAGRKRG